MKCMIFFMCYFLDMLYYTSFTCNIKCMIFFMCCCYIYFQLERIGPQHQAGSDSLLTGAAFFKMKEVRS